MVPMTDGELVARSMRSQALTDDCDRAALIVSDRQSPRNCGAAVIDQARLRRQGALALWRKGKTQRLRSAVVAGGRGRGRHGRRDNIPADPSACGGRDTLRDGSATRRLTNTDRKTPAEAGAFLQFGFHWPAGADQPPEYRIGESGRTAALALRTGWLVACGALRTWWRSPAAAA